MPDFKSMTDDELRDYISNARSAQGKSAVNYLFEKAGMNPGDIQRNFAAGLLQTPGYQPEANLSSQGSYLAGKYGPTAAGGMLGAMVPVPGLGPLAGAAAGSAVGGMLGRSLQNTAQAGSNLASPGVAPQKTAGQLVSEPLVEGAGQGMFQGALGLASPTAIKTGAALLRGGPGIAEDIGRQALGNLGVLFSAKSMKAAGEVVNAAAEKAGIKSGTEGLELATAKMFGEQNATRFYTDDLAINMANKAEAMLSKGELGAQEALATRQAITRTLMAPKYLNPKSAANARELFKTLDNMDGVIAREAPDILPALSGYRDAVVRQMFSSWTPQNLNKTASVLKIVGAGAAANEARNSQHPGGWLAAIAMMSPFLAGNALRMGYLSGPLAGLISRSGVDLASNAMAPNVASAVGQIPGALSSLNQNPQISNTLNQWNPHAGPQ